MATSDSDHDKSAHPDAPETDGYYVDERFIDNGEFDY